MSGFTRGPWSVRTEGTGSGRGPEVYVEGAFYDDGSEFVIADCGTTEQRLNGRWMRNREAAEREANACLIAAAKDLYKALKALLAMMDRGSCPRKLEEALTWRENDELARKLATNALAKAEGRNALSDSGIGITRSRAEIEAEIKALEPSARDYDTEKQSNDTCIAVGAHDALRWLLGLADTSISETLKRS